LVGHPTGLGRLQLPVDLLHDRPAEILGAGDQERRGSAVLGLTEQVGRLVGYDPDLGGTDQQVYAHDAVELALGLGDVDVAGADYLFGSQMAKTQLRAPIFSALEGNRTCRRSVETDVVGRGPARTFVVAGTHCPGGR
jgi:hypothetical protein